MRSELTSLPSYKKEIINWQWGHFQCFIAGWTIKLLKCLPKWQNTRRGIVVFWCSNFFVIIGRRVWCPVACENSHPPCLWMRHHSLFHMVVCMSTYKWWMVAGGQFFFSTYQSFFLMGFLFSPWSFYFIFLLDFFCRSFGVFQLYHLIAINHIRWFSFQPLLFWFFVCFVSFNFSVCRFWFLSILSSNWN